MIENPHHDIVTFKEKYQRGIEGKNLSISMGFKRLTKYVGLRRQVYYLIGGYTGCLGRGTKVIMFDGSLKNVEDVQVGDLLMGPDSTPRTVLDLKRGVQQMYWVRQNKGMDYRVNEDHIISLRKIRSKMKRYTLPNQKNIPKNKKKRIYLKETKETKTEFLNISVKDYLSGNITYKNLWKGFKVPVDFPEKQLKLDPYFLGLWLGDGTKAKPQITNIDPEIIDYIKFFAKSIKHRVVNRGITYDIVTGRGISLCAYEDPEYNNCDVCYDTKEKLKIKLKISAYKLKQGLAGTKIKNRYLKRKSVDTIEPLLLVLRKIGVLNNKHIPENYLINSRENRLKLLAGLLDSDGSLNNGGYNITQKNKNLANDITYLSRSLGFYTSIRERIATMKRKNGTMYTCLVYDVAIYGNDLSEIPCKIKRKKVLEKSSRQSDCLSTGFTIEKDCVDEYFGFSLDGDQLFLLEDFTVTHNSAKTSLIDNAFILNPIMWYFYENKNPNIDLKILYFSMERSKDYKIARWLSSIIFLNEGVIIPVDVIMGWNKIPTKEEQIFIDQYLPFINKIFDEVVTLFENPLNPTGAYKEIKSFAEQRGKKETITITTKDGRQYDKKVYKANNPEELVLIITDTINLTTPERKPDGGPLMNKKEAVDKWSEHMRYARDFYGYSPVVVSQFNREIANPLRLKNADVQPQLEDFSDSSGTQNDAEIIMALFDPMRYKVNDVYGYDLTKLRENNNHRYPGSKKYRQLSVLKNSYGADDVGIGLAFQPQVGYFKELPYAHEMTDEIYERVLDNSYFLDIV